MVGYDVLDFLALIEAQSAVYSVRDILFAHVFLETAALGVRAV